MNQIYSKQPASERPNDGGNGFFMHALLVVFLGLFSKQIDRHVAMSDRDDKTYRVFLFAQLTAYFLLAGLLTGGTLQELHKAWNQGGLLHYGLGLACGFFALRTIYIMGKVSKLLRKFNSGMRLG